MEHEHSWVLIEETSRFLVDNTKERLTLLLDEQGLLTQKGKKYLCNSDSCFAVKHVWKQNSTPKAKELPLVTIEE